MYKQYPFNNILDLELMIKCLDKFLEEISEPQEDLDSLIKGTVRIEDGRVKVKYFTLSIHFDLNNLNVDQQEAFVTSNAVYHCDNKSLIPDGTNHFYLVRNFIVDMRTKNTKLYSEVTKNFESLTKILQLTNNFESIGGKVFESIIFSFFPLTYSRSIELRRNRRAQKLNSK